MVEFLHFDIQSTGQKSQSVNIALRPSLCFVLIKQSDSPCPYQFCVSRSTRRNVFRKENATTATPSIRPQSSPAARPVQSAVGPPVHRGSSTLDPQSQSFSRSYGSILPTSLIYIVLSTRGCSPWRPDAVMSTTRSANKSLRRIFKGRRERTGHLKD